MPRMVQIRNVPDDVHRQLKSRAALAGMSMSEFILQELKKSLSCPSRDELLERIRELAAVELSPPADELIRADRERR